MDFNFKEPTLHLHVLLHNLNQINKEELRNHLIKTSNVKIYTTLIERGVFKSNPEEIKKMEEDKKKILGEIEKSRKTDPDNETFQIEMNIKEAEFYAKCMDINNALKCMNKILITEISLSLHMDIYLCKIRLAIILKDKKLLQESIEGAADVCMRGCDWDRRNKFKMYKGLHSLMKAEFKESAELISECLPSFESNEVVSYDRAVLYLIFTGLLTFDRQNIKSRILESSDVLELVDVRMLGIGYSLYNCDYSTFMVELYSFLVFVSEDVFLSKFVDYFCKEMKLKAYKQLLSSYQSLSLKNMADAFGIEEEYLEKDLSRFIVEDNLNCKIDKIGGNISVEEEKVDDKKRILEEGARLLRSIKKHIK